ncbi:MAG TPA: LysM peptidoglycan-binding domain-containing protein [Clostridiaceae bacterium]|nr:LysM peptidoglycan-binding domain-containing protein [Clostridiaceae bacterium]
MKKRYVLKNKLRFGLFVVTAIFIGIVLFCGINTYSYKEKEYETLIVLPGDTLWEIAKENNKSGNIRRYIYEIKKINHLEDSIIYPGMNIKLP